MPIEMGNKNINLTRYGGRKMKTRQLCQIQVRRDTMLDGNKANVIFQRVCLEDRTLIEHSYHTDNYYLLAHLADLVNRRAKIVSAMPFGWLAWM